MIDHISIAVSDLERSLRFYDAALEPLGYRRLWSDSQAAGYGASGRDEPFAIKRQSEDVRINARFHIAFAARDRESVVAFYRAAIAAGAVADGAPGLHPEYGTDYFAAFVLDPDGYRVEAVCHGEVVVPTLYTGRLLLTIPGGRAAEAYVRFHRENEQHLAPWSPPMTSRHFDMAACAQWLNRQVEEFRGGSAYSFTIFDRTSGADGPVIGSVHFTNVVRSVFLACYMGYNLAKSAQGNGYMTEACRAAIDYIFDEVRLHRIMANYMPHNHRSAAVLQRLGFTIEGTAKDYLYLAGRWHDHVLTSLTNPRPILPYS